MSSYMQWELLFFLQSAAAGVLLFLIYGVIKSYRKVRKSSGLGIALGDLIYWIGTGIYLTFFLYKRNSGILRGYFLFSVLLGMLLYMFVLANFWEKIWIYIFSFLKKMLKIPERYVKCIIKWLKLRLIRVKITIDRSFRHDRSRKTDGDSKV